MSLYNRNCAIKEYSRKQKYTNVHGLQRNYKMPVKRKTHFTEISLDIELKLQRINIKYVKINKLIL